MASAEPSPTAQPIDPDTLTQLRKALAAAALTKRLTLGDAPGHDFHGNQHTGGLGGGTPHTERAARAQAARDWMTAAFPWLGPANVHEQQRWQRHIERFAKEYAASTYAHPRLFNANGFRQSLDQTWPLPPNGGGRPQTHAEAMRLGDSAGHDFHGNQHTGGIGGGGAAAMHVDSLAAAAQPTVATGDAATAAAGIAAGREVSLTDASQLRNVITRLGAMSVQTVASGGAAPHYNLAHLSVAGTHLFGGGTVDRIDMPQLGSKTPLPGSPAAALPRSPTGSVNITGGFRDHLTQQGVQTSTGSTDVTTLRAAQNEVDAFKTSRAMANPTLESDPRPFFVSNEGQIGDGHHRMAGIAATALANGRTINVPVVNVNLSTAQMLAEARAYSAAMGVPPRGTGMAEAHFGDTAGHDFHGNQHTGGIGGGGAAASTQTAGPTDAGLAGQGRIRDAMKEYQAISHPMEPEGEPMSHAGVNYETAVAAKVKVMTEIAARSGQSLDDTRTLVHAWAQSSSDTNSQSVAIQQAITERFGAPVPPFIQTSIDNFTAGTAKTQWSGDPVAAEQAAQYARDLTMARPFVAAMYANTQVSLAAQGITSVTMMRGMALSDGATLSATDPKDAAIHALTQNPASAWTISESQANRFANMRVPEVRDALVRSQGTPSPTLDDIRTHVMTATFPASQILSTSLTGIGCFNESEVTVIGRAGDTAKDVVRKPPRSAFY